MKLSERLYKAADDYDKSASVWEHWEADSWRKLADEVAKLEAELEKAQKRMVRYAKERVAVVKAKDVLIDALKEGE